MPQASSRSVLLRMAASGTLTCLASRQNDLEPGCLQPVGQVLREGPGLEADRFHAAAEAPQTVDDRFNLGRHLRLKASLTLVVHDANRDRPQRDVDSGVVGPSNLSFIAGSTSLWRARRATNPPDHRCSWPTADGPIDARRMPRGARGGGALRLAVPGRSAHGSRAERRSASSPASRSRLRSRALDRPLCLVDARIECAP